MTVGDPSGDDEIVTAERGAQDQTRRQLRGSTLLVAGRGISLTVNFLVQVLIVRYLTQAEYGGFAYALAFVHLAQTIITFGLDRAITRFVPIYEERGDYGRLFGTLVMVGGTLAALGLGVVVLVIGLQGWLAGSIIDDPEAITLVVLLIALAPIQALDELLTGLFAVIADARAIFLRRNVIGPFLRLAVVLLLVLTEQQVEFLAIGYVVSGAAILLTYTGLLVRQLRKRGLTARFRRSELTLPVGEVLGFTIPLLTSDLVSVLMTTTDVLLLGFFHDTVEVGAFRAVLPAAMLNQAILSTFGLLYTPAAARLFARDDHDGIDHLYWRTAAWLAVFSFPVFLLTSSLAEPITVLLFGEPYRGSAPYLAILSIGMYFNAALGLNGLTLKVMGRLRYIVILNLAAAAVNVALNLLLIPPLGALGAAIATGATLVAHNVLKQAGLSLAGIRIFERRYVRLYAVIVATALGVLAIQAVMGPPVPVVLALAALASALVVVVSRDDLDLADTFPELRRIPLIGRLGSDRR
jgi:O-antigen/teichoic acid export membrane protein